MTMPAYAMLLLGMMVEIVSLWRSTAGEDRRTLLPGIARTLSWREIVTSGLMVSVLLVIGVAELLGLSEARLPHGGAADGILFVVLGLFILGAGLFADHLLPRVSEPRMLAVSVVVLCNFWAGRSAFSLGSFWYLALIPTIGLTIQMLSPWSVSMVGRVVSYLWFLVALMVLTFQNSQTLSLFDTYRDSPFDAFAFGAMYVFLMLHLLFAIRFALIASSLLLPRNRPLLGLLIPRIVSDERVPVWCLGLVLALAIGLTLVGRSVASVSEQALNGLLVLLLAQSRAPGGFSRPRKVSSL